ncbi:molybdate ABC transporter substrate-binding protein [Ferrovibrio sp.]|uniref:molybdate ABC transporter substrate-binding protein n=1 Tax=Ferrovibrio sp. TaxID=1917215 RepID=UPI001B6ACB66|nr:molybdate ABC transporter substrate-binding protein [Ferrovibrio sp.]MBP7062899.1 molybdate ABC transporter substrate-binding protein [Ferrovibrio sp.]
MRRALQLFCCLFLLCTGFGASARAQDLLVFAAASLKTALDEIHAGQPQGLAIKVAYAASSALARQIEAGAPADIFISADLDWMDYVQQRNLLRPGSRSNLLGNRLSLVAPVDSKATIHLQPGADLAALLGKDGRLAMGDVNAVPAGKYGKAALQALNIWPQLSGRIAQAENVRAALALVARGEAPLGIVYRTDAANDAKLRVLADFPENSHPPIIYPAAVVATSKHPQAAAYLARLREPSAAAILTKFGFALLPADAKIN